jgi:DnaJ-class molecular chaperone
VIKEFEKALKVLGLTSFVTYSEIKLKYRELSKKYHPDFGGDKEKMDRLNKAFNLLKEYIENYRFTFSEEELQKQHIGSDYASRFRF